MMRGFKVFAYCILGLLLCSCVDKEGQELKSRLSEPISVPSPKGKLSRASIEQYRDAELAYNQRYVDELKKTLDNSFEKQLENFDKNELGFFSSYENMFHYIFWNKQKFEDSWKVKSSRYFNTIDVKNDALSCYENYIHDVSSIRKNFYHNKNGVALPEMAKLDLPTQDLYLGDLKNHSRNNLIIEIGVEALVWILVLLILFLLSLIIAVPTGGLSLIVTVLTVIISIWLSIANDNKLLNSLREQNSVVMQADYSSILNKLNENTYRFYGK